MVCGAMVGVSPDCKSHFPSTRVPLSSLYYTVHDAWYHSTCPSSRGQCSASLYSIVVARVQLWNRVHRQYKHQTRCTVGPTISLKRSQCRCSAQSTVGLTILSRGTKCTLHSAQLGPPSLSRGLSADAVESTCAGQIVPSWYININIMAMEEYIWGAHIF